MAICHHPFSDGGCLVSSLNTSREYPPIKRIISTLLFKSNHHHFSSRRLTDAWSKDFPEMKNISSWLRRDWMKYLVNYSLGGLLRKALSWSLLCADKGHILVLYSAHCGCMSSHNFHDQVRHQTQERRLGTSLLETFYTG